MSIHDIPPRTTCSSTACPCDLIAKKPAIIPRFWAKVDQSGRHWIWTAQTVTGGYGRFTIYPRKYLAHRVAFVIASGCIPDGLDILHECDIPGCCNPQCLRPGTDRDNVNDKIARGRVKVGQQTRRAKLDGIAVYHIRHSHESLRVLGQRFGVDSKTIHAARTGRTWGWLQ